MGQSVVWRRISFINVLSAVVVAGIAFIIWGSMLPVYTDADAARLIKQNACLDGHPVDGWGEGLAALETWRHSLMQIGVSLLLAAGTLFLLHRRYARDEAGIWLSPQKRSVYFLLGYFVLANWWVAMIYSLDLDMRRGEFPWCADSIGIPAVGLTYFVFALTGICTLVAGALVAGFGSLPVSLRQWDSSRKLFSVIVTLVFAVVVAVLAVLVCLDAPGSGFLSVPGGIVAIYLALATRAALLAPRKPRDIEFL